MSTLELTPSKVAPRGKDPAVGVYYKLAFFSVAMFAAPISAYFFAKDRYLNGNPTYAGGLAALVANLVLIAYIVAAFLEDQGDDRSTKTQPPTSNSVKIKPEQAKKEQ